MFRQPKSGFRFSAVDAIAIVGCAAITAAVRKPLGDLAWLLPITLAHFFLFCNVFRVHRYFELAWAGLFIANVLAWVLAGGFCWSSVLAVQTPITLIGIAASLCSSNYHGIGASLIRRGKRSESECRAVAQRQGCKQGNCAEGMPQ